MQNNSTNSSDFDSFFSVFPSIMVPVPTKLKPKIIKSSKKTRKIKKIMKSTAIQPYTPSLSTTELESSSKGFKKIAKSARTAPKVSTSEDFSVKKLKDVSKSMQFMAVFLIIFKLYSIIVKRISNISRTFYKRDFKGTWNQCMLTFTELAKYLKDLSVKTKIIKTNNNVKSFALLTDSFYKSIKIYENLLKKKKNFGDLLWKTLKFVPNLMKVLINFDYIIPLEVLFPSNFLILFAFSFKIFGILRKARRLIRASIKRWNLPKRRAVYLLKLLILFCKMIVTFLGVCGFKELAFYFVGVQVMIYMIIFLSSLKNLAFLFSKNNNLSNKKEICNKMEEKNVNFQQFSKENNSAGKENKAENMILSRRIMLENRMAKEEISI